MTNKKLRKIFEEKSKVNIEQRKAQVLQVIQRDLKAFLEQHPDEVFYVLGFDATIMNPDSELLVCLNTEEEYQRGIQEHPEYADLDNYIDYRYNAGDWLYRITEGYDVFTCEEVEQVIEGVGYEEDDDIELIDEWCELFYQIDLELLADLCRTEEFKAIPKTSDFKVICTDHDQDIEEGLKMTEEFIDLSEIL